MQFLHQKIVGWLHHGEWDVAKIGEMHTEFLLGSLKGRDRTILQEYPYVIYDVLCDKWRYIKTQIKTENNHGC
jgi:hypothetical protein